MLANRLKKCRNANKILQKDIANYCNISERSYRNYETGIRLPTSDILAKLADFFDVSIDYLVGRTDNPNSHKN